MRIWTVHPGYLDTRGLLAAWREGLLAQKVLKGETKGFRNHPQLRRFKEQLDPVSAIAAYLRSIYRESVKRGYNFNKEKIDARPFGSQIVCTRGQLLYEWNHLEKKLKLRSPGKHDELKRISEPRANPIFRIVAGKIEDWEVVARR